MKISFPSERPDGHAPCVWHVQQLLLQAVESLLGPREGRYTICQPRFLTTDGQPHIWSNADQAGAYLSTASAGYWPTLVYELAHETVHLLNPVVGSTNLLEEGVAVAFSVSQSALLTDHPQRPSPTDKRYVTAHSLVEGLPGGAFPAGRLVRERFGALGRLTQPQLESLFPAVGASVLTKLAAHDVP
jgi:hypothetical protein